MIIILTWRLGIICHVCNFLALIHRQKSIQKFFEQEHYLFYYLFSQILRPKAVSRTATPGLFNTVFDTSLSTLCEKLSEDNVLMAGYKKNKKMQDINF